MTIKKNQKNNILGIDRGSKYIGLAYGDENSKIIFPLGYILNDSMTYFNMAEILHKHTIKSVVIGRPSRQKNIQEKIIKFMESLNGIVEDKKIAIYTQEEDYSSVQSGEILSETAKKLGIHNNKNNYRKNSAQDTISAMIILQRRKDKKESLG